MANDNIIPQDPARPLNIYRASAGSGKTHLLTGFYLKLLFVDDSLPETHSGRMKFGEVLAVTFTNKATAEMKGRIIEELNLLSHTPTKSHYWHDLSLGGKRSAEQVKGRASELLTQILNDYSAFNISTIDSFFQRIVRSFARELNLPGNYEVQLEANQVLDVAISNFLDNLGAKEYQEVYNWMSKYVERRMEDGANWDFRHELTETARKVLTSETYRQHSEQIQKFTSDKQGMTDYVNDLWKVITSWRTELRQIGQDGCRVMSDNGLMATDFSGGKNSGMNNFGHWANGTIKVPSDTFMRWVDDPTAWFPKKSTWANNLPTQAADEIQAVMRRAAAHFGGQTYCDYMTAQTIVKHFYELGILASIDQMMIDYCNDQNVMLISSTNELLASLIKADNSTPFIYEKTGTRIHSYMIDEFQDTSAMQWHNFRPLVSETLATGYQNLIVGDVKQSIYRWRGGDWNLLHSGLDSFEPWAHHDDNDKLRINWRSRPAIVDFNNEFFGYLSGALSEMIGSDRIRKIYQDVKQEKPKPKEAKTPEQQAYIDYEGLLKIQFLHPVDEEGNEADAGSTEHYVEAAKRQLPEIIIKLQENGYRPKDIGILCRYNKECRWVAEALLDYKQKHPDCPYPMDIISNEALVLGNRPIIKTLISLLRHIHEPKSVLNRAIAWSTYYQLCGQKAEEAFAHYSALSEQEHTFHPELAQKPLYELCEELIGLLPEQVCMEELPFLQAFRDIVLEYAHSKGPNLPGFLEYWDENCESKSISIPEGQDAMTILSVHKSKGLGMPAIIMPFASWDLDLDTRHEEIVWCEPAADSRFARDGILVPIALNKTLESTIFADVYKEEREKTVIDNLNIAYVAFTRAKEALVIMTPEPPQPKKESKKESHRLEDYVKRYCTEHKQDDGIEIGQWKRVLKPEDKKEDDEEGARDMAKEAAERAEQGTETQDKGQDTEQVAPDTHIDRTALPNITILHDPDKRDVTVKERGTYIHAVLEEIREMDQAEEAIKRLYARGDIDREVINEKQMTTTIRSMFGNEKVKAWFRPGLRVLNEQNLVDEKGNLLRADRIVIDEQGCATIIDYKTGSFRPENLAQVRAYMEALRQMGFGDVKGCLYYIKDNKVVYVR